MMTAPAMRALKESAASRHITLMTSEAGAAIAPLLPEIDQVICYDAPWLKSTALRSDSTPEFAQIEQLRQAQFDAAVIFTVYSQNPLPAAFLCYLTGIPLRLAHCHENPYQLLTHWVKDSEPETTIRHEVQRQLDLVASVGCSVADDRLKLAIPDRARQRVQQILQDLGFASDQPWVVIHPGASAASRRYPPEQYAIVARTLATNFDLPIILTGTRSEQALVDSIQSMMGVPSISLVDRLDLAELAALLAKASLLISNNTGPAHLAAAVGTPIVDLYALTNPQHTPWKVPCRVLYQDVPCKFCYKSICPQEHHHCLRLVEPDRVVQAAIELLFSELDPVIEFPDLLLQA